MSACDICGEVSGNKFHAICEMMNGVRDVFRYVECPACGCMRLENIPDNIAAYYPEDYYSFKKPDSSEDGSVESFLNRQKTLYRLGGKSIIGRLLSPGKRKKIPQYINWFRRAHILFDSKILDVGCGAGAFLLSIQKDGFRDLLGVDPYIKSDIIYDCGVKILKKELSGLNGQFDLIMLNHSLEHMTGHFKIFEELRRLLKDSGCLLIRMPVMSSFAWREYGVNWVQCDAPRHLFLHSVKSLKILAEKCGFEVRDTVFDSTEFQFWGSIQYQINIPLNDPGSYTVSPGKSIFSQDDIKKFKRRADELNKNGDGDQACFYLYKN